MAHSPDSPIDPRPDTGADQPDHANEAPQTAELQSELQRVLVDHELERGMTITRIPQPRRRRRRLE
jgi:hypothetical protein